MTDDARRPSDPRAEALLQRFSECFGDLEYPVPVDSLATDLLGLLVAETDALEVSGLLIPSTCRVYLNAREAQESAGRRRFTLAHEIGHWVCQCDEGRAPAPEPILCRASDMGGGVNTTLEREANNFAASLLLPEAPVRDASSRGDDVEQMAQAFGVSDIALQWRLYNLDLTEEHPAGA